MDTAARIKALRARVDMSHDQVAAGSGDRIDRTMMSKLESGKNKASTARVREGLATAFGVQLARMSDYLDGKLTLDALLATRGDVGEEAPRRSPAPPLPNVSPDDETPLQRALNSAFDSARHELRDARTVERVVGPVQEWRDPDGDLVEAAGRWLDFAAAARRRGEALTLGALLLHTSVGKGAVAAEAHARHKAEIAAHVDQRVAKFETEHADELEPPNDAAVDRLKARAKKAAEPR